MKTLRKAADLDLTGTSRPAGVWWRVFGFSRRSGARVDRYATCPICAAVFRAGPFVGLNVLAPADETRTWIPEHGKGWKGDPSTYRACPMGGQVVDVASGPAAKVKGNETSAADPAR